MSDWTRDASLIPEQVARRKSAGCRAHPAGWRRPPRQDHVNTKQWLADKADQDARDARVEPEMLLLAGRTARYAEFRAHVSCALISTGRP